MPDGDEGAQRHRDRVQIGRLTSGIERRQQEQASQRTCKRRRDDLRDDISAAPGTAMPVCKVALAVGTSRHESGKVASIGPRKLSTTSFRPRRLFADWATIGAGSMTQRRAGSLVLLAGGLVLIFAGVSAALDFSVGGMVATAAAITALLYAGGVWFGAAPAPGSRSSSSHPPCRS